MSIFLDQSDVAAFTGRKTKSGQIDALRSMGIACFINPSGRPIVPKSAVEGKDAAVNNIIKKNWEPAVLVNKNGQKTNQKPESPQRPAR